MTNVRIVHWRMGPDGSFLYMMDENGSIHNFANINVMVRTDD